MGFNDFKRCDGFVGSVPQKFVDASIPQCPLCGSGNPYWTLRDKIELKATRVQFRCQDCGGVLSATEEDFSGRTKSTAHAMFSTAGAVNALMKKRDGKDLKTVYVRVDELGSSGASGDLLKQEIPLEKIQAMGAALNATK